MSLRVTGPRVAVLWSFLLAVLTILNVLDHGGWFELAMWLFAVLAIALTALMAVLAGRRAPVHRGTYVLPTSASPGLVLAAAVGLAAVASVYGSWFAVVVPVPFFAALYLAWRDRRLKRQLLEGGSADPKAPPFVATAGIPERAGRDGSAA